MVDVPRVPLSRPRRVSERRRKRLARELTALYAMRGHMRTRDIVWAVASILGVALLCVLVAAKLHWLAGSLPLTLAGALAAGVLVWLIARHWLFLAWLIVIGLVLILLEDIPDLGWGGSDDKKSGRDKEAREVKLERAIARREALLRGMEQAS